MECIIGFRSSISLQGEDMQEIKNKFQSMSGFYSPEAEKMGVEFVEIDEVTRTDDGSYSDNLREYILA